MNHNTTNKPNFKNIYKLLINDNFSTEIKFSVVRFYIANLLEYNGLCIL